MVIPGWGKSPKASIERECARRGRDQVVAGCIALLEGRSVDAELIYALGGPPAAWVFTGTEPGLDYWLRVWALRGLLWTWDDSATPCLGGLLDKTGVSYSTATWDATCSMPSSLPTTSSRKATPAGRPEPRPDRLR